MSYAEFYLNKAPLTFAGSPPARDADFIVIGVPFDSTSTYRGGQRFAPAAIREASVNIEANGFSIAGNIDRVKLSDWGDIYAPQGSVESMLDRVEKVVGEISSDGRVVVALGGEHTITLGVMRGLKAAGLKPCLIVFDAHFDLKSDYMGVRFSHATVMRRIVEEAKTRVFYVAVRAFDEEELRYASESENIDYVAAWSVDVMGVRNIEVRAKAFLSACRSLYLSIDIDFLDPAFAPGAANPEPGGLTSVQALTLLARLASDPRIVGVDLVEVSPPHDCSGITPIVAAKLLQQAIIALDSAKKR